MIGEYSVRISRANDPCSLLGSGTLLIKSEKRMARLLACSHVIENNDSIYVEFYAGRHHGTIALDESSIVFRGNGRQYNDGDTSYIAEDCVCFRLPWEDWMSEITDTRYGRAVLNQELRGYGFPKRQNGSYSPETSPMEGGSALNVRVSNVSQEKHFYCRSTERSDLCLDDEMTGYSGTGLFDDNGNLIGIVKGRNKERNDITDLEFAAIAVFDIVKSIFDEPSAYQGTASPLVRMVSDPLVNASNPALAARSFNLQSLLYIFMDKPILFVLFNTSAEIKYNLEQECPFGYSWKKLVDGNYSIFGSGAGTVITTSDPNPVSRIREAAKKWASTNNCRPLLINIDLTSGVPDSFCFSDLSEWRELVPKNQSVIQLFSDNFFSSGSRDRTGAKEIENLFSEELKPSGSHAHIFGSLEKHILSNPLDSGRILSKYKESLNKKDDAVMLRLRLLHSRLTGLELELLPLAPCEESLSFLSGTEKIEYMWRYNGGIRDKWDEEAKIIYEEIQQLRMLLSSETWFELAEFLLEHDPYFFNFLISRFNDGEISQDQSNAIFSAFSQFEGGYKYRWAMALTSIWGWNYIIQLEDKHGGKDMSRALSNDLPAVHDVVLQQKAAEIWQIIFG